MSAGKILAQVKQLCKEKKFEEAKELIQLHQEELEENYPIAQKFIELKQGNILDRFKSFFGVNE